MLPRARCIDGGSPPPSQDERSLEAFDFARLQAIERLERRGRFIQFLYPLTRRGWIALPALYVGIFALILLGVPVDPDGALLLLHACATAAVALVLAEEWSFNQRLRVRTEVEALRRAHQRLVSPANNKQEMKVAR